jgi:hypothetical protein
MAEVFAGAVCGYAIALAVTPVGAVLLLRARAGSLAISRLMPEGTNLVALLVVLHMFVLLAFTAIGFVLGVLLHGMESSRPDGALGSPNIAFTLLVVAIAGIAVVPLATVAPRVRTPLLLSGFLFAGIFGWAMPHLAALA